MDYNIISVEEGTLLDWARSYVSNGSAPCSEQVLKNEEFDHVTIPWNFPETWVDNTLEIAASKLSKRVEILHSSGKRRMYQGENLHRLSYNKAYLASMFQVISPPRGKTILEAGCSDGLVCDILALAGAERVIGIDVMKTVGCSFPHERIQYQVMDISRMNFPDQTFDIVYSIATFEHLANPYQALLEILRVIKTGGYGYIQAGPLYYSPFGHHMFQYFEDYPWIHLRKSKDAIVSYSKERGIDKRIQRDLAITCEQYIEGMLTFDHVNGLLLEDYRLDEFRDRDDIEILKFNISYEGRDLLTAEIAAGIPGVNTDRLVEHGFEIAFRRLK
jgi:SAM-dependent methyltransferase